jgi:hypothetical protein
VERQGATLEVDEGVDVLASRVLVLLAQAAAAALVEPAVAAEPAAAVSAPVAATPSETTSPATDAWAHDALTRALAASREIEDPFHRAQALAEIAEAAVAIGEIELARTNLTQAEAEAGRVSEDALRAWALHDLAMARIKANDLAAAETTADAIRDARLRDIVLAAVVDARRGARDVPGALASARRIQDSARQGMSLRSVALLQVANGDISGALATARSISHAQANALAVGDVAAAIARDGGTVEARLLAGRIRDNAGRSRAFVEIAAAQAGNGDILGAREALEHVSDKLDHAEAQARIAAVRSELAPNEARAMFAQAVAAANGARAPLSRKCETLVEIARGQVVAKSHADALATLKQVLARLRDLKKESDRLTLLSRIAPLQARAGDFTGAFDTAMRADDPSLRPLLVRDIAAYQVEQGDAAGALEAARNLNDRPAAAAAFFGILRAQVQTQDKAGMHATLADVLSSVRTLRSPELRAGALGSLAAAQVLDGNMDAARATFAEAMTTAAGADRGQQQTAVYVRIADALANRRGTVAE